MTATFKQRLQRRDHQLGLWLSLCHPTVAEVCADTGFDWILLDAEHAPNDATTLLAQLRAAGTHGGIVVRPRSQHRPDIGPLLDLGVRNLLIPMVDTVEQARALVDMTRFPPHGSRGHASSLSRASGYGRLGDYAATANGQICVIAQIETPSGVQNADRIAEVDGVDALFLGLFDLSATLGHPGHPDHPDVIVAIHRVVEAAERAGKPIGTFAPTPSLRVLAAEAGCHLVAVGSDVSILVDGSAILLGAARRCSARRRDQELA